MLEDNANLSTNWQDIISFTDQKSDNSAIGYLRAETCYASSYNPNYYGVHWHDNPTYAMSSSTSTLPTHYKGDRGVWHHCVMTFDSEGMATGYTDGVLVGSYSNNNAGGHLTQQFWLGDTNNIAGCINDVRIYKDQILSEQEIKKLSQGLVLHLPLSRKGFGLDNIIKNSQLHDNHTTWYKSSELTTEFTTKEGFKCFHITGQNEKLCYITPYFTTTNNGKLGVQQNGNTYVLSVDMLFDNVVKGTKNYYISFYKNGETIDGTWRNPTVIANSGHMLNDTNDNIQPDKMNGKGWQRIYLVIQFGNYAWARSDYVFMLYFRDFTGDIYVKNAKVEIGDKVTHWTPNPLDPFFNQLNIQTSGTNLLTESIYGISHWTHTAPNYTKAVQNGGKNTYICNQSVSGWWENVYSPAISVTSGKTYTLSCLYKVYSDFSLRNANDKFGLCVQNAAPTNSNPSGNTIATILFGNANTQYVRGSVTFTPSVNTIYLNIPGGYIGDGQYSIVVDVDYIKLEEGSIVTPWNPDANIAYDISGYQHNATVNNITYSADTVINDICTHFGGGNAKVHISGLNVSGFNNSYSFAWWGKRDSNFPMFWGFSDGCRLNGMYYGTLWNTGDSSNNPLYNIGTTTQVTAPSVNVWHHYVMTGNGTKCYVYLDGVLWAEAKTYKPISGTSIYLNGWDSGTSYCSTNMDLSDFRIYATALTADEILDLYERRG